MLDEFVCIPIKTIKRPVMSFFSYLALVTVGLILNRYPLFKLPVDISLISL